MRRWKDKEKHPTKATIYNQRGARMPPDEPSGGETRKEKKRRRREGRGGGRNSDSNDESKSGRYINNGRATKRRGRVRNKGARE